jgi:hypothetical protein
VVVLSIGVVVLTRWSYGGVPQYEAPYSFNVIAHNCALRPIISSVCKITKLAHNVAKY